MELPSRAGPLVVRVRRCGRRPLEGTAPLGARAAGRRHRRHHGVRVRGAARAPDPLAARDAYVDVVLATETPEAFAARLARAGSRAPARRRFLDFLEAQRWRLAMFTSDGWFWDDPIRPETRQILRFAARAVRMIDGLAGTRLERSLVADLALFASPGQGLDGAAIYRAALSEVGQPGPSA